MIMQERVDETGSDLTEQHDEEVLSLFKSAFKGVVEITPTDTSVSEEVIRLDLTNLDYIGTAPDPPTVTQSEEAAIQVNLWGIPDDTQHPEEVASATELSCTGAIIPVNPECSPKAEEDYLDSLVANAIETYTPNIQIVHDPDEGITTIIDRI